MVAEASCRATAGAREETRNWGGEGWWWPGLMLTLYRGWGSAEERR
jgi:hypothetical protein